MRLHDVRLALVRHGVTLALTPERQVRAHARQQPPAELIEAMRERRAPLLRQVEWGQFSDGRLDVATLSAQPGHCGSCARWTPTGYPLEGECSAGRRAHGWFDGVPTAPVLTHPGSPCQALEGRAYKARRKP